MAKSINLRTRTAPAPEMPTPPRKPRRDDPSHFKIPPAAQSTIAGQQQRLPLPTGRPVTADGQLITRPSATMQAVAHEIRKEASTYVPPVDPETPPLVVETADISQLSPEERAVIQAKILETVKLHQQPAMASEQLQPAQSPAGAARPPVASTATQGSFQPIPGYRHPGLYRPQVPNPAAYPVINQPMQPGPEAANQPVVEVDVPPAAEPAKAEVETEAPAEDLSTFGGPTQTNCPHCGFDLSQDDIPEPGYLEKQAFLQAVLGERPFSQEYDLLGGEVKVTFRTLTTKEVDAIYTHVTWEKETGRVLSALDYFERINRHRMYLQLVQLDAGSNFRHELPDGLSKETNPHASAFYDLPEPAHMYDRGLGYVEDFMVTEVLRTEMLLRAVHNKCNEFNRLVARLEALIDNSDFWKRTEPQS